MVVAMLAAAMIPWWPIYESGAFVVAASLAIIAGSAVAVAGAVFHWPAWAVVVAVFGSYLLLGVPAAVPGSAVAGVIPTPQGVVELLAGAALSWKQLVTIAVPVGSYQALLVPPFLLGLVAATSAVTIALRSRRPAAAIIPPAVLLLVGIALGVVHAALAVWAGLAFLITSVAWLVRVAIANRRAISAGRPADAALADARRVLGASALVAVALVGATAASVALPVPPRTVVRAELQPPFEPRMQDSPLAGFRAAFAAEVRDAPMLEVRGLPAGAGIRIATLDTYDGIVYSVGGGDGTAESGRFTRVPYRLDQSDVIGEQTRPRRVGSRVRRRVGARRRAARAHLVRRARAPSSSPTGSSTTTSPAPPPCRSASRPAIRTPRTRWRRSNPRASRCCGPAPACCPPRPNCPTGSRACSTSGRRHPTTGACASRRCSRDSRARAT